VILNNKRSFIVFTLLAACAVVVSRVALTLAGKVPFNADEAVVGLMARHMLQGEWTSFFWGQAYMGSLDAALVAGGFAIFGAHVWVIRLVQSLLYAGTLVVTGLLAYRLTDSWLAANLTVLAMAIPTVNVMLYTTASLGGYGEALLLGMSVITLAVISKKETSNRLSKTWRRLILIGLLAGIGFWANAISLVFVIPAICYLVVLAGNTNDRMKVSVLLALGFLTGSFPWWWEVIRAGLGPFINELTGSAVAVEQGPFIIRSLLHLRNFVLLGVPVTFGLRPPWSTDWIMLPWGAISIAVWIAIFIGFGRFFRTRVEKLTLVLILGPIAILFLAFILTSFGVDPSGRYFLPIYPLMAVMFGVSLAEQRLCRWYVIAAGVVVILGYQLTGIIDSIKQAAGLSTQFYEPARIDQTDLGEVLDYLEQEGELCGYSSYWFAYPAALVSEERIIFVPKLPYHPDLRYTPRDNRYQPYSDFVDGCARVAYVTTKNPNLDEFLAEQLTLRGVTWKEKVIGDFRLFTELSVKVVPVEIGLGELRTESYYEE
jgi:4-amino-4-deoxy-L-arabinose transferase-like glycosyltransferase